MPKKEGKFEYYIKRKGPATFEVAKFDSMGSDRPQNVYTVEYAAESGKGKCNCQAAVYRGTGSNDKHVRMVANWVANGDSDVPKKPEV